jgi:hypothetical protein
MYNPDPLKQNLSYAISKASYRVKNNGTLQDFEKEIVETIKLIDENGRH